ncbi:hypothetical protein [uncultured Methanobrevibacter sp.]|uniref:hypothetical protein n=1 Tax=uncultured Methanobrevibacter sp. TaxID=253161 RepID=UPI0025D1B1D6|nr:hypothetical protein [uncultured Methanobrevibacter sp.]
MDCQKDIIISKTDNVEVSTDYAFNGNDSKLRMGDCKQIADENVLKDLFLRNLNSGFVKPFQKRFMMMTFSCKSLGENMAGTSESPPSYQLKMRKTITKNQKNLKFLGMK